jgi:hypothetical protein
MWSGSHLCDFQADLEQEAQEGRRERRCRSGGEV